MTIFSHLFNFRQKSEKESVAKRGVFSRPSVSEMRTLVARQLSTGTLVLFWKLFSNVYKGLWINWGRAQAPKLNLKFKEPDLTPRTLRRGYLTLNL